MQVTIELVESLNISGVKNGREWSMNMTKVSFLSSDNKENVKGRRMVTYPFGTSLNYDKLPTPPFVANVELGTGFDMRGDPETIFTSVVPISSPSK